MTVSTTVSKSGPYAGAGTTGPFTVGFRFLDNAHLRVVRTDPNGTDADLALDTDYSVTGAGAESGEVTLFEALETGYRLTIVRDVPATQEADYVENDAFPAESHETALDKLTMLVQQLDEESERSIKVGVADTPLQPLPGPAARSNTVIGFDAMGNVTVLPLPSALGAGDRIHFTLVAGVDFTAGVSTQVILPRAPGSPGNLEIFFDPLFQGFDQWSVSDLVVTFSTPIPAGVTKIFGYIGTTLSTQIPPSGSVDDSKIVWVDILNRVVTSVAQLKALDTSLYTRAFSTGFYASGDGGGGHYWFNAASVATEVPGLIVAPNTGSGRWELIFGDALRPEQAGAKGNGTFDDQPALQAVSDFLLTRPGQGGNIKFSFGRTYAVGAMWNIPKTVGKRIVIDGAGARLQNLSSYDDKIMRFGEPTGTVGGPPLTIRDVQFNAVTANATGIYWQWGGASVIENCGFTALRQGMMLESTYALVVRSCTFISCNVAGILVNNTTAHHLMVSKSFFYDNARDIYFAGAAAFAYNLLVDGCDMEGGSQAVVLEVGGSTVCIHSCYIEGKSSQPILFGGSVSSFSFKGNWMGFMPATQSWTNISGGELSTNIFWDQAQNIGPSCHDLDISHNTFSGTSNQIYSPFTAPALLNGFADTGGGYAGAGYRKDGRGIVHLRGMIQAGADNTAFNLPVGYRPSDRISFPIVGVTGATVGKVDIFNSGDVVITRASGTADISSVQFTAGV